MKDKDKSEWEVIFNAIGHPTIILGPNCKVLAANNASSKLTGKAAHEIIGKHCYEIFHGMDITAPPEGCPMKKLLQSEQLETADMEMEALGGFFMVSCTPVFDEHGNLQKIIHIATDISERKQADIAFTKIQTLLNETARIAKVGGWEFDVDTMKLIWTEEVYRIHEVDLTHKPSVKEAVFFYAPESRPIIENAVNRAIEHGDPFDVQLEIITAKGNKRWVHAIGQTNREKGKIKTVFGVIQDITGRKKAQEKLLKSEAFNTAILASIPLNMFLKDRSCTYLMVNKRHAESLGLSSDDFAGKTDYDFFPPEIAAAFQTDDRAVMESREIKDVEERYFKDGQYRWAHTIKSPVIDSNGDVLGVLGFFDDITERKRTAELMRENEEKFRNLFNNSEVGMFRSRLDGSEILDMNQKFLDIVGKTREEIIGKPSAILWAYPKEREDMVRKLVAEGRVSEFENTMLNKRGDVRSCLTSLVLYREQGILEGSIIDITERKTIEKALKESEERFRSAFEHAAIGFSIYSTDGHFLKINKTLCAMLGYSEEELMSMTFQEITHPDDLGLNTDQLNELLSGKLDVLHFQKRYIHKLGHEVWASLSVSVVCDDKGSPIYLISLIEDLTEKRKLEEQLRQAQKMEAVGTLAGGIAHDFNNILNVILGYGIMVQDSLEDKSPAMEQMKEVLAAADRAASLTKRLLLFSRKEIAEFKPIDVNKMVINIEKMLSRIIGEDIRLVTDLMGTKAMITADAGQMEQVLMNLAANARDAMPKGGSLTIKTELREIDTEFINAYEYGAPGTYAVISISDTGAGIEKEKQPRIFDPFFTTKEVGKGTGLGLSIAYGIIKQHNGYIKVYSEPERGTTFKIWLPVIEVTADRKPEVETLLSVKGGTETILVAEDDTSLRKLTQTVLEAYGYSVITAEDGEDAIAKFMDHKDRIALVIMDMTMPRKSGKEAGEVIRQERPLTKILFATGYSMDTIKTRELSEAGFDFIHKPVRPQDLLKKVREILDK